MKRGPWLTPEHHEAILVLSDHGWSKKAIARVLGCAVPTVRYHLRNAA